MPLQLLSSTRLLHFTAIEAARKVNADVAKAYEDYHKQKQSLKVSDLNRLKVVSKTGIVSDFNANEDAQWKAAKSIGKELTEEQLHDVLSEVAHWLDTSKYHDTVATSDLHPNFVMGGEKSWFANFYTAL